MRISNTSQRLKEIMKLRNLRQVDILEKAKPFCKKYNVKMNKSDLSQYVSGLVEPGQEKLSVLGMALDVSETWLMGFDVPMRNSHSTVAEPQAEYMVSCRKIPVVGTIAAGSPILAEENIEEYFNIDSKIKADFALRIKGDSMIGAGIFQDDIVFIKKQDCLQNGEIGAVLINSEATLKKFYKNDDTVILQAENDKYQPMIYTNGDIRILGKLVAVLNIRD